MPRILVGEDEKDVRAMMSIVLRVTQLEKENAPETGARSMLVLPDEGREGVCQEPFWGTSA